MEGGRYWRSVSLEDIEDFRAAYGATMDDLSDWQASFDGHAAAILETFEEDYARRKVWRVLYASQAWTGIRAGRKLPHLVLWYRVSNFVTWHLYHRWVFQRELEDYCGT